MVDVINVFNNQDDCHDVKEILSLVKSVIGDVPHSEVLQVPSLISKRLEASQAPHDHLSKSISELKSRRCYVKWTGMIQDMRSTELYLLKYPEASGVGYASMLFAQNLTEDEIKHIDFEAQSNVLAERSVLCCVSVPAQTDWAKSAYANLCGESQSGDGSSEEISPKRFRPGSAPLPIDVTGQLDKLLVMIYFDSEQLKLNDVVEILGILYYDNQDDGSNLPVLHTVSYRKLLHTNPLICQDIIISKDQFAAKELFSPIRSAIIDVLTKSLFGDSLSAEYLLYHLLSSVHCRSNSAPLGKLSLNLCNVPRGFGAALSVVLGKLLTTLHYISMSLSVLNSTSFLPKKDYENDELKTGLLQHCNSTNLVLDETCMCEGQLIEQGLRNLGAIRTLLTWQKLDYDFQYNTCEFLHDTRVLILSEGRSMFKTDILLPIEEQHESELCNLSDESEQTKYMRMYLTIAKLASSAYEIPDSIQSAVEADFVEMRQQNSSVSADDLHRLLTLSRLITMSYGQSQLTSEFWNHAKTMEQNRNRRVQQLSTQTSVEL